AVRGAAWREPPFSIAWADGSVLATFRRRTETILRRATPDDDAVAELRTPPECGIYPRTLHVSPRARWLAISTEDRCLAIVAAGALDAAE
nr:hypothetical protein [Myxococcota bacterium]